MLLELSSKRLKEYFIDFKCQDEMKKEYFIPPKDQLTTEQQNFAADNIIKNLEKILFEI